MQDNLIKCSVLIVDDDNDLCNILSGVIRKICPVHVEHSLKNADQYLEELNMAVVVLPDIVLLDNNLPDGAGVKYIKHIHDQYPEIKVVLMTADSTEGLKEKAFLEGATYFISKPFRITSISDILLSICPGLRAA